MSYAQLLYGQKLLHKQTAPDVNCGQDIIVKLPEQSDYFIWTRRYTILTCHFNEATGISPLPKYLVGLNTWNCAMLTISHQILIRMQVSDNPLLLSNCETWYGKDNHPLVRWILELGKPVYKCPIGDGYFWQWLLFWILRSKLSWQTRQNSDSHV